MISGYIEREGKQGEPIEKLKRWAEQFRTQVLNHRCLAIYDTARSYNLTIFEGIERRGGLFRKQDEAAINTAIKHGWKIWVRMGDGVRELDTSEIEGIILLNGTGGMIVQINMKRNLERIQDGTYISSYSVSPDLCGMDPE